jgi:hypothetical protein
MTLKIWERSILIFFFVVFISFVFIYDLLEPYVQSVYQRGYEKGKNETCKFLLPSEKWVIRDGDYVPEKSPLEKINVSMNFTIDYP